MVLSDRLPPIPHNQAGECCGCIISREEGATVELVCNECSTVVGVVHRDVLEDLLFLTGRNSGSRKIGLEPTIIRLHQPKAKKTKRYSLGISFGVTRLPARFPPALWPGPSFPRRGSGHRHRFWAPRIAAAGNASFAALFRRVVNQTCLRGCSIAALRVMVVIDLTRCTGVAGGRYMPRQSVHAASKRGHDE
jgi:hypothetical protein